MASAAKDGQDDDFTMIKVGIDGPFGAPAQRFYTFDKSIIVYVPDLRLPLYVQGFELIVVR